MAREGPQMSSPNLSLTYSFRCRNCQYARQYGHAKLTALTKATSHALRLSHIVDVWETHLPTLTSEVIETITHRTEEMPEEAPF